MVYAEAADLIEEHRAAGREIVIVSSSRAPRWWSPSASCSASTASSAPSMVVADGRYTGEIDFYAYGENKAEAMRELAAERGYDLPTATPTATPSPTCRC